MSQTAQQMADEAKEWLDANPGMWSSLVEFAMAEARAKRRFSISEWVEFTRYRRHVNPTTPFKIKHSIRAVLARLLVREHPEVRPYMSTSKSILDVEQWELSL